MRGEDEELDQEPPVSGGSPPHARGRLVAIKAGEGIDPDHPRMRGEDDNTGKCNGVTVGSPPHARGRQRREVRANGSGGITPACAGKTIRPTTSTACAEDHPRMRGEDDDGRLRRVAGPGSPPHARGRHRERHALDRLCRITPACAGKTHARCTRSASLADHPRMRGEDS